MGEKRDRSVEAAKRAEVVKNDPQAFPEADREQRARLIEYISSDE